jgi:hypothetical protein
VSNAQRALRIFYGGLKILIGVTLVLCLLVVLAASNRRRGLRNLSVAAVVAFSLGLVGMNRAVAAVPELIDDPDAALATKSIMSVLTDSLFRMSWTLLVVSLMLAIWAIAGRSLTSLARRFSYVTRAIVVVLIASYLTLWGAGFVTLVGSAVVLVGTLWWLRLAWWRPTR